MEGKWWQKQYSSYRGVHVFLCTKILQSNATVLNCSNIMGRVYEATHVLACVAARMSLITMEEFGGTGQNDQDSNRAAWAGVNTSQQN